MFIELKEKHPALRCFILGKLVPLVFQYDCEDSSNSHALKFSMINSYVTPCGLCHELHVLDALHLAMESNNTVFLRHLLLSWYISDPRSLTLFNWKKITSGYPHSEQLADVFNLCIRGKNIKTRLRDKIRTNNIN